MSAALIYGLAVVDVEVVRRAAESLHQPDAEPRDFASAVLRGCLAYQNGESPHFANATYTASAYAVKLALDGVPPGQWLPCLLAFVDGMDADLDAALYRVGHAAAWGSHPAAVEHIGRASQAEQVALAVYHIIRYPDDFTLAVEHARTTTHDAALLVGGLSAARLGIEAIPHTWIDELPDRAWLDALVNQLNSVSST